MFGRLHMLRNLPPLAHDQTLYSWCGHAHLWNGLGATSLSRELFVSPYAALLHDFPAYLGNLEQSTKAQLGTPEELALRHTLLGYFLPLVEPELAAIVLRRVHDGAMPEIKMKLGITASRVGGHHPLKGCFACFDEDESIKGFAYWHVSHQFPSVAVCDRHHCPLSIAWDPVTPVHRRDWLLPRCGLKREWIEVPIDSDLQMERLLSLATLSVHFSQLAPGALDSARLAQTYQTALRDIRLVTAHGSLRLKALIERTRFHYRGVETVPGFEVLQSVTPDWPGLTGTLARQRPKHGHPLKHLLLIAMLFDSWDDFISTYDAHKLPASAVPQATHESRDETIEQIFHSLVMEQGLSIRAASIRVGISVTTGVQWARKRGVQYLTRTQTFSDDKKAKSRKLIRRGLDISAVANAVGVSRISINRLRAAEPELGEAWTLARFLKKRRQVRSQFTQLIHKHPTATVNELRQFPGNPYTWLYRHDRDWLRCQIPSLWKHHASGLREL